MKAPDQLSSSHLIHRRQFLKLIGAGALAALLESCQSQFIGAPSPTAAQPTFTAASPTPAPATPTPSALPPTAAPTANSSATPLPPRPMVAIDQATSYDPVALRLSVERMLGGIGGLSEMVKPGARVGLKVNLTGTWYASPAQPPAPELFVTHPAVVSVLGEMLRDAGASRLLILDGLGDEGNFAQWGYTEIARPLGAELIDLCKPNPYPDFVRTPVSPSPFVYDTFLLNGALNELDVLISVAKLKVHSIGGVTLSLKNMIGIAPISKYRSQEQDNHRSEFHESWIYDRRLPRVILDLCQARPIHLALIDGVLTCEGGTGPWDPGMAQVRPGLLLAGKDPVATDAVSAAVMGFDPTAADRASPFNRCDNYLALAQQIGLGTHRLEEIGLVGPSIEQVKFPFKPVN